MLPHVSWSVTSDDAGLHKLMDCHLNEAKEVARRRPLAFCAIWARERVRSKPRHPLSEDAASAAHSCTGYSASHLPFVGQRVKHDPRPRRTMSFPALLSAFWIYNMLLGF